MMHERLIRADKVELATEAVGDSLNPAVLLIMGGVASMLWWPEEFCRRLASDGRYVIRYDNRDTGLSTKYPAEEPPYTLDDMADDAIRVLDGYAIAAAHIVGMSLGGMIGQIAALKYPSRVISLTVISSSPLGTEKKSLPSFTKAFSEHMSEGEDVDWSDTAQVVAYMIKDARVLAGTGRPIDEAEVAAFIEHDYERAGGYLDALRNHAALSVEAVWQHRVHEIRAPLLVIHGTEDPVYPIEHGIALAQAVDGAKLVRVEGGGHELHRADWDTIISAIVEHTTTTKYPRCEDNPRAILEENSP
jgi:pimeloyl-ACP methyl ester carboxylesterase